MQQVEDLGAGPPLQISVPTAREDKTVSDSHVSSRSVPVCSVCPLPALQEEGQSRGQPKLISWAQPFLSEPLVTLSVLASCHPGTILFALVPSPQRGTATSLQAEVAKTRPCVQGGVCRVCMQCSHIPGVQGGVMSCSLGY